MVFVEADFEGLQRTIIKACLKERMGIRGSRVHRSKTNWFHLFRQPRAEERVGVVFDISSRFIYIFLNGIWNTRTQLWFITVCFRKELLIYKDRKRDIWFSYLKILISIHRKLDFQVNTKSKRTIFTLTHVSGLTVHDLPVQVIPKEKLVCLHNFSSKCNNLLHLWNYFPFCLSSKSGLYQRGP